MKTVINENQKGLLFKNGKFERILSAGNHRTFGNTRIEILDFDARIYSETITVEQLLMNDDMRAMTTSIEIADGQLGLHFSDGKFVDVLDPGKHAYFNEIHKHTFMVVDLSEPEVTDDIPKYIFSEMANWRFWKVEIMEYEKGRLFLNNKFVKLLEPGTYYFWKTDVDVKVGKVDTRLRQMMVAGQEILSQDKVTLRVNFICTYRIKDFVKIVTEIEDYEEQMHVTIQLALRQYIGKMNIDDILKNRDEISTYVFDKIKEKEKDFFVEFTEAGVRDIVLPGEIRTIMNTVLIAEKRAQANVITRREEVASTRSLLNTAKLMEENKTLYKLKELEFIERICENVGSLTVNGNGDLLSQLNGLLQRDSTN